MQINDYYKPLLLDKNRFCFLKGGAGSGKSYFCAQKILLRMMNKVESVLGQEEPNIRKQRFLIIRKVKDTCAGSVYQLFQDIIYAEDIADQFEISKSEQKIVYLPTGSELRCVGLDDPEKIKSIAGITGIWVEEMTECTREDIMQLNLRMRGFNNDYYQILGSFNPIEETHWIKAFVEDEVNETGLTLNESTFLNNAFLTEEDKKELMTRYKSDERLYTVYVLGQWGKIITGLEFYKNFRRSIHVQDDILWDMNEALHLSLDDNTRPYFPGLVFQIKLCEDGYKEFRIIDEVLGYSPNNTTSWMAKEFTRRFRMGMNSGLFIYGDATAKKDDVKLEKGIDMFQLVINGLERFKPSRRVAPTNPNVKSRGEWINALFDKNTRAGKIRIIISSKCAKTIEDMMYTTEDANGKKDKTEVRDKQTKKKVQPYGHLSDCMDYALCYLFMNEYTSWQYGGGTGKFLFSST